MADRKNKKSAPVKGGAAANPQAMATVASHKDDTAQIDVVVEGEVKADEDAKVEETVATAPTENVEKSEEPAVVVDPDPELELELEQKRNFRKEDLRLRYNDNPQVLLTSADLSEEDKVLIGEIASEQNQVVRDYAALAQELTDEKDQLEQKLDATNSKLGNVTNLISSTVTQTVGQVDKETSASIEGLKTEIEGVIGKGNGVKNAVTKIGDDVNKDIGSLKGQVNANAKSVNDKVDGMVAMLGQIDEKISEIKSPPPPQQPPAQSSATPSSGSSGWPWVAVVGLLLAAALIAVFLLNKDVKIEVQVQQPAVNTVKGVVPPVVDNALGVTSQQVTPGGPGNPIVPTVVGATSDDPCKGKVGGELGSCVLQLEKFRPKGFSDASWNTVVETFQNVIMVPLSVPFKDIKHHDKAIEHNMRKDAALQACVDAYVLKTDDVESNVRCQRAVDCLFTPVDEAAQCYLTHTRSITGVLVTVN